MLVVSALQSAIGRDVGTTQEAIDAWCDGYATYVSNAIAGPVVLSTFSRSAMAAAMAALAPVDFFAALDSGVVAGWATSVWISPGFTGASLAPSGLSTAVAAMGAQVMALNPSRETALAMICSAVDTYTRTIPVVWTNATSGATGVATMV